MSENRFWKALYSRNKQLIFQVTWLASWTENIQNQIKYVMLNPSSRLKGEKDMEKYEKARRLKSKVAKIREDYTAGKRVFLLWLPFGLLINGLQEEIT